MLSYIAQALFIPFSGAKQKKKSLLPVHFSLATANQTRQIKRNTEPFQAFDGTWVENKRFMRSGCSFGYIARRMKSPLIRRCNVSDLG